MSPGRSRSSRSERLPGADPMWHITRNCLPAISAARMARRSGSRPFCPTTESVMRTFTPSARSAFSATALAQASTLAYSMLSISPGASPPAKPMEAMWTKPNRRVRDWGTTPWRKLPKVYAPASPADTAVVVAVIGTSSSAGSPMPRCGQRCVCRSISPGVTSLPAASMRWTARSGGMLVATAAICPKRMPMSRLARVFCTGSSTSPLAITSSYLRPGSLGLKPSGTGVPAWAIMSGAPAEPTGAAPCASPWPASAPPAAAALAESVMKRRRERSIAGLLPGPPAHGGGLAGQLELLAGVGDRAAVDFQDGNVAVYVVAHVEIAAVRTEDRALGEAAHLDLADLGHLLAVDLEHRDAAVALGVEPGALERARAAQQHRHRHVALRADDEAFGRVADHHAVDHPRRRHLQINHADRIHVPVRRAGIAVVGGDGDPPVGRDVHVVGPLAHRHVELVVVGDLLAVDVQHRDLVRGELHDERALAVRRDGHRGHLVPHRHRVHELHVLALNGHHADRLVRAVGDERQIPARVDGEAGRLPAHLHGGDLHGRAGLEVEHVELVVRRGLPGGAVLHPVHRVGHEGQPLVRGDGQVGGRPEDRVHQGEAGHDARALAAGEIHHHDGVLARRYEGPVTLGVEHDLLIVADDHEVGGGGQD